MPAATRPQTAPASLWANGLQVAYEAEGAGPPLILLHGASSAGRLDFGHQLPLLRRSFRCYLPDARGHGGTRWSPDGVFAHEWLVDDLAAFADALGLASVHLVGLSMGAATALGFAIRHPERVRSIVLAGITPEREPRASVARRLLDPARIQRQQPAWAATLDRRHDPVQGDGAWEQLLPLLGEAAATQPLPEPADMRRVTAPALVIVGDRDPFVPVDQAAILRRQLGDGRLLVVPDCGHEAPSLRPALVNEALAAFYRPFLTHPDRAETTR
jgi:pimeloyl-ACP methyl ester carboxylesterase